jgi:hypothetical protein
MTFAIDYDGTYTTDPETFDRLIELLQKQGHEVICVTMRYKGEGEEIEEVMKKHNCRVVYTGRKAKQKYMLLCNKWVDVWIDDTPQWICMDAADVIDGQSS